MLLLLLLLLVLLLDLLNLHLLWNQPKALQLHGSRDRHCDTRAELCGAPPLVEGYLLHLSRLGL